MKDNNEVNFPKREHAFNINNFYSELKNDYNQKLSEAMDLLASSKDKLEHARRKVENHEDEYKIRLDIVLADYEEWKENKYIDGTLLNKANFIHRNRKDDNELNLILPLIKYSALLKTIATCEKNVNVYYKILSLDLKSFRQLCRIYYYEVQHQLIANGYGYKLAGRLGWVCINRVKNTNDGGYKIIDTKATKAKEEETRAAGKKVYNTDEAAYYKMHGLKYDAVDCTVYNYVDATYEVDVINPQIKHFGAKSGALIFDPADTWSHHLRGYTVDDILKESNGILRNITCLDIPFRTKINCCLKLDNTLYVNFIRNENQISIAAGKNRRKGR